MASIFTKIINGEIPGHFIFQTPSIVAFLDVFPRSEGHTLVVPIDEVQRLRDLEGDDISQLFKAVQQVTQRLHEILGCDDCSIIINDGPSAGQEIPHVHVHVIPRWSTDDGVPMTSILPVASTINSDPGALSILANRLSF